MPHIAGDRSGSEETRDQMEVRVVIAQLLTQLRKDLAGVEVVINTSQAIARHHKLGHNLINKGVIYL